MLVSASRIVSRKGVEYINALYIQNISSPVTNILKKKKKNNLSVIFSIKTLRKKKKNLFPFAILSIDTDK